MRVQHSPLGKFLLLAPCFLQAARAQATQTVATSPLVFSTSDAQLQSSFDWAKRQALAYVANGQDPVGPWYEAALPGRNAFCMRDVSHQAMGAAALGLSVHNRNMLSRFAAAVSASKQWAGYWEIDRTGKPSPFDYVNDDDFWYNLPANFDVMNAAFRMLLWTGDSAYVTDRNFLEFYRHTVSDYVLAWQLEPGDILQRPRIMNRRLAAGKFVESRGIPGYDESHREFNLGTDLLAAEYRALSNYSELQHERGYEQEAKHFEQQAAGIAHILETSGWNAQSRHFYNALRPGGDGSGTGDAFILYFEAATNSGQMHMALEELKQRTHEKPGGIEEQSYRPEILLRCNAPEEAYSQILDLSRPDRERREYPEVSFSIIGSIVTGVMGVNVVPEEDKASSSRLVRKVVIQTLPRFSGHTLTAELHHLPVRQNVVDIRHRRNRWSSITNSSGPRFTWRASFDGSFPDLIVNGKKTRASQETTALGEPVTYVDVPVQPAQTITASR